MCHTYFSYKKICVTHKKFIIKICVTHIYHIKKYVSHIKINYKNMCHTYFSYIKNMCHT